jgi:hypothetical protein
MLRRTLRRERVRDEDIDVKSIEENGLTTGESEMLSERSILRIEFGITVTASLLPIAPTKPMNENSQNRPEITLPTTTASRAAKKTLVNFIPLIIFIFTLVKQRYEKNIIYVYIFDNFLYNKKL